MSFGSTVTYSIPTYLSTFSRSFSTFSVSLSWRVTLYQYETIIQEQLKTGNLITISPGSASCVFGLSVSPDVTSMNTSPLILKPLKIITDDRTYRDSTGMSSLTNYITQAREKGITKTITIKVDNAERRAIIAKINADGGLKYNYAGAAAAPG